jgi:hypothetical protein
MAAFDFFAFSSDAFDVGNPLFSFPTSLKDPNLMQILGLTPTQTLLYDFSETETFYILAIPPEPGVMIKTLFSVSSVFASRWFPTNASNKLKIIYNPFLLRVS